jgi:hypothetical protein
MRMAVLDDWEQAAASYADWASLAPDVEVTIFTDHVTDPAVLAERLRPFELISADPAHRIRDGGRVSRAERRTVLLIEALRP